MRTPSTTQIGAFDRLMDETPRTRTVGAPPSVDPGSTTTPGALAVSMSAVVEISETSAALATSTVESALPSSTLRAWPVAVVTTSSSCAIATDIEKLTVSLPVPASVIVFFCDW